MFEVERRLLRLPHRLYDGRERIQRFADQADDEVVVFLVEAVAGQADIVGVVAGPVRHTDSAMFGEDRPLFFRWKLRKPAAAPQRIPNRPWPVPIQDGSPR